jgi:flagella basal body P-ring formation protein FlgA
VGQLDPRLHLAPCLRVEPYLPAGSRLWGRTRIGLRCTQGSAAWNVYLPVTVKLFGRALVATTPLAMGSVLTAADVAQAEVDLAEDSSAAVSQVDLAVGRTLTRSLNPGQSLRQSYLRARQWFAAGETVKVVAAGEGFSVAGEGQALTPGVEGQPARVKTESGRVLTGMPTADHRVDLAL